MLGRLPDEHCRHTTALTATDFKKNDSQPCQVTSPRRSVASINNGGKTSSGATLLDKAQSSWAKFMNGEKKKEFGGGVKMVQNTPSPADYRFKLTGLPDTGQYRQPAIAPTDVMSCFRS